jgi:hypothetical protein
MNTHQHTKESTMTTIRTIAHRLHGRFVAHERIAREGITHERGDVPGWVLITLMTAGLVVVIWALAGPALSGVFQNAIDRVSGL